MSIQDIIEAGDWKGLLSAAMNARTRAENGEFCQCEQPDCVGRDLMCGTCGLEVLAQRENLTRAMNTPHPYEPMRDDTFGMCDFCSRWKDDPIHRKEESE